uniref:tRNA uridine 5-carboxymethylaminomethyl modification enzyme C-terminal N-terninal subdomain domain-containing protein n=1 Tax=Megaselia scalaris TaxID=36166 RepID=T1GX23_MEGSC
MLEKATDVLKSVKKGSNEWRKLLNLPISKASNFKSAFDMLAMSNDNISCEDLAKIDPSLKWISSEPQIAQRIKIEALYEFFVGEQMKDVEAVRKEEMLVIPKDIDYFQKSLKCLQVELNLDCFYDLIMLILD